MKGGNGRYYVVIKDVNMSANKNVQRNESQKLIRINTDKKIISAKWLDNGKSVHVKDNVIFVAPFLYGTSHSMRVAEIVLK